MPTTIDWLYHRKNCDSCEKANSFFAKHHVTIKTEADARKDRHDDQQALALTKGLHTIISTKGKSLITLDLKRDKPDEETILAALMGPTGNLRAPTFRIGKTLMVGFNEATYAKLLK